MTYANIPEELISLNQWMVTRAGSKKPYSPRDLTADSWNDPACWGTFAEAVSAVAFGYAEHIGLVLRKENGIVAIDLDNKPSQPATPQQLLYHSDVLKAFGGSYTERSVSNTEENECYHIFVKGSIPRSVNKEKIELRCDNFIVVTGDVDGDRPRPIINGYEITTRLEGLARFLGAYDEDLPALSEPATRSDDDIWNVLCNSANNEKLFIPKQGGDSDRDYDIACWITKLTRNKEQAIRLFLRTPYAQGKKSDGKVLAESMYHVNRVIEKALNETQVPAIDISKLVKPQPQLPAPPVVKKIINNPMQIARMPEGWCKEFAKFALANSMSPLEEAAVFNSFLPVCGVGGRVFSASNTGLNQQFTLLALTGTGKDEAVNATQRVLTRISLKEPGVAIQAFMADDFASAQGIHRALVNQPVMFGYNKESGMWMERMSKPNPDEHMLMINAVMLDIYNLHGAYLKGRKYAKKDNDLDAVYSPTLSTMSVSTPKQFYDYLSVKMLETGITGRELIFECEDTKAKTRPYKYVSPDVPQDVIDGLIRLAVLARKNIADITFGPFAVLPNSEATADLLEGFSEEYVELQNEEDDSVHRAIWSRANLKMRKLAATMAVSEAMMHPVGDSMQMPLITAEHVHYAAAVVDHCAGRLQMRLEQCGVGNLYLQQEQNFDDAVDWYFSDKANLFTNVRNPAVRETMFAARAKGVIFKSAIMTRCAGFASFSGQGRSTAMELDRTLKGKIASGVYAYLGRDMMIKEFGTSAEAFCRVDG